MDIPLDFMKPTAKVVPDPARSTLVVEVDSGDRSGNFVGKARLVPARGTSPAPSPVPKTVSAGGHPLHRLAAGEYKVISDITTRDGQPLASVTTGFCCPRSAGVAKGKRSGSATLLPSMDAGRGRAGSRSGVGT
ncbi:MAG: hypothetical protein CM1200mP2_27040 [Planctomycetaceae bacterium]|nr:MAG: hypothetical protein CM1200mP2_27040 [Planctomycetaceae bacterium]